MSTYFFEPLDKVLHDTLVSAILGSQVVEWDDSRKREIGLLPAYILDYEYNKYLEQLSDVTWTLYNDEAALDSGSPESQIREDFVEYPAYFGKRTIVALSGLADSGLLATAGTNAANQVVTTEVEKRLSEVAAWENTNYGDSDLTVYKNALVNIGSDSNYPEVLAYEVDQKTFTNWPTKPTISLDSGPSGNSIHYTTADHDSDTLAQVDSAYVRTRIGPGVQIAGGRFNYHTSFSYDSAGATPGRYVKGQFGINNIVRNQAGRYTITFDSANQTLLQDSYSYMVMAIVDYKGDNPTAGSRSVTVNTQNANSFDLVAERTDTGDDGDYNNVSFINFMVFTS